MKKKQSLMSFLCFLLCLAMTLPAFAGGFLHGSIRQNGQKYDLFTGEFPSGDGWNTGERSKTGTTATGALFVNNQALLMLDNFKGEEISLDSDGDIVLVLADGSVNEVDFLSFVSYGILAVEGNGTLIIGELEIVDDDDDSHEVENPLDFISIADGSTVDVTGRAYIKGYDADDEEWDYDYGDDVDDEEGLPFTDVPDDAYYWDAVQWAIEEGITKGTSDTTFAPDAPCTRGQVATFLWRANGCLEPEITENPFTDVDPSSAFYKAILWAYEWEITTGTSATTFSPGNTCTYAHVITFLWRSEDKPAASGAAPLADSLPQGYYTDAVRWADSAGLLNGTGEAFAPSALCPRADIVTYLYRVLT